MRRILLTLSLLTTLAALAAGNVFRDTLHESTQEGRRLYDAGKYAEALAAYGRGRAEEPDHPVLAFNVGDTLLAMGKTDEALAEYRKALSTGDSGLKARTYYNMGNAYLAKQDLPQAIDAYRQSLLLDPSQKDAKRNLELALRKQKEQQQSKNDKNQKDKNQTDKDQQSKDQQAKDQQGKDQPGKDQQGKDQQTKDRQAKNQQAKDQPGKDQPGGKQGQRDARQQPARAGQQDKAARMDKAQALQLLQALSDQERAELFQLLQQKRKTPRKEGKDW